MNLVGNLEDLGLGEILQIVSLSRKSGILTLRGEKGEGEIVFRQGEVVRAASPDFRETLPELLVREGVVDQSLVERALAEQERKGYTERIGTLLSRRFNVPAETVDKVVREQLERIVISFFYWTTGTFDFELQDHADMVDAMDSEPMQFVLEEGINSQYLALEGARRSERKQSHITAAEAVQIDSSSTPEVETDAGKAPVPPDDVEADVSEDSLEPDKRHVIILVDDHPGTREKLALSLEECGYEVYTFAGGADSPLMRLASLQREGLRPLLLVDLSIPKMDGSGTIGGIELLELLKANMQDVPALVMADSSDEEAELRLRGMNFPLIMKPGDVEIGDKGVLNDFMATLLPGLNQARSGWVGQSDGRDVNLAEELFQEMGGESATPYQPVVPSTGLSLLRGMLEELKDPSLEGGIILLALRFAAEFMNRGIIFMVRRDRVEGLGQFGITPPEGSADSVVRSMKIPISEDSIFRQVITTGFSLKTIPDENPWTRYLLDRAGGREPVEMFIGPIVSEGKVVALLYGDNVPEDRPIGDTDSLEIFLSQAGVAMEKAILLRKLKGKGLEEM
jgi:CheY-like chemotaxis protein